MSSAFDRAVRDIIAAIQESGRSKTSPFDRTAKVVRVDEEAGIAWVHFPGGVDETPVNLTIAATAGDTVQVRSGGGKAWITGNATAPPTDDTTAKIAKLESLIAGKRSQKAKETADNAVVKAENAVSDAIEALEKANDSLATDTLHYLATPLSSGVTRDTQGWTTTVQTMTKTNKYLWTYHTYTTADGTTTNTDPIITGTYGEKGDKGDSPTITTTKDGKTTTIKADGVSIGTVIDGEDGSSPTVSKSGKVVTITDASGTTVTVSDGEDGASIKGDDGEDAYFHVAWANSSDGTEDFSTTVATNKLYMGTYTDHTQADSTTPSKYKWVKVKGEQGVQGHSPTVTATKSGDTTTIKVDGTTIATILDGSDGNDGHSPAITTQKTGNTTTIYADGTEIGTVVDGDDGTTPTITATKSGSTTTVKVNGTTIATINDGTDGYSPTATVTKSGNTATITITDKNGTTTKTVTDGTDGDDGISITAVQPQYYLSTSDQNATGGSWGTSLTYEAGKYIWTRDKISYSEGSPSYSTAIYNEALTQACANALEALTQAQEVSQYTWHTETDTGAGAGTHITFIPQDEFLADPANGGVNLLANSLGVFVRDGLTVNAYYASTSRIGGANDARMEVTPTSITAYDQNGVTAFRVQTGVDAKTVKVTKNIDSFIGLLNGDSGSYTIPTQPTTGTTVTVKIWRRTYVGSPFNEFTFTYGQSGTSTQNGLTLTYNGTNISIVNTVNKAITEAEVTYTITTNNSLVDIPAELTIQTENFTQFLFSPSLTTIGLTDYQSRVEIETLSSGYIDIGKWRFVNLEVEVNSSLGANNNWAIVQGFAIPFGNTAPLSAECGKKMLNAYVNYNGRLVVVTGSSALAAGDVVQISGWYLKE